MMTHPETQSARPAWAEAVAKYQTPIAWKSVWQIVNMTVKEYVKAPKSKRLGYRFYRHPLILFGLGPIYTFFISHRVPAGMPRSFTRERASVYWTDLAILTLVILMGLLVEFQELAMVQLPMTLIAATVGVWMFYAIGLHHIHHLSPKTPNYLLQKCLDENPILQVKPLTLLSSCKCILMSLWDEQQQKLISFGSLRSLPQAN